MYLKCQKHLKMSKFNRNIIILSIGLSFLFSQDNNQNKYSGNWPTYSNKASILKKDSASYFRIPVLGGGCAGFQYKFDFENLKKEDDILIEEEKINVVIDETSMELIQNSKIDYVTELIGSSFKITNPQASSSCGCGTSFSI